MSGLDVMLSACAVLTVVSALLAVTSTRVVHAALWLVVALGAMAGVYLVLGAEVVALVQVLVYVGSVVVLVLFALMLTRAPTGASTDLDSPRPVKVLAAVVGLATAVLSGAHCWPAARRRPSAGPSGERPARWARWSSAAGCCRSSCSRCCCWPRWWLPSR